MGSPDPPLAVHCLYRRGHRQHRRRSTGEVYLKGGPLGGVPLALLLFTGLYLFVLPYVTSGAASEAPTERADGLTPTLGSV